MYDVNRMEMLLAEAAEDRLGADDARTLEAMLGEAPDSGRTLEEMRVLVRAEKALAQDMPEGLHEHIMDGVAWNRRLDQMQRRTKLRALSAAAVACLVLLGAGIAGLVRNGGRENNAAVESVEDRKLYAAEIAEEETFDFDDGYNEEKSLAGAAEPDPAPEADLPEAMPDTRQVFESETDDPIEQRLALNTDCHTIVIADFTPPEEQPLFTLDGYKAYELEKADFDAIAADEKFQNAVYYTNYDGTSEKILLALRPQENKE